MAKPSLADGFFFWKRRMEKVFNITVENAVEKNDSIFVSDSVGNGSAFCTGAGAGTFVVSSELALGAGCTL
jgi:hypothetical protein